MLIVLSAVLTPVISFAVGWFASMLLPLRHPAAFWAVMASQTLVFFVKSSVPLDSMAGNIVLMVFYFAIVPLFFWRAALAVRVVCAASILALVVALEMLSTVVYTKLGYMVGALALGESALLVLMRLVYIGVLVAAGVALSPLTRRLARVAPATGRAGASYVAITSLLAAQMLALLLVPALGRVQDYRAHLMLLPAAAASFAAMLLGLRSLARSARSRAERLRARELENRLESHLALMRDEIAVAETAARFRHDQRNHVTAVRRLVEAGEMDAARRYVSDLKHAIEAGGAS